MCDYSIASDCTNVTAGVAVTLFGASTEDAKLPASLIFFFIFLFLSMYRCDLANPRRSKLRLYRGAVQTLLATSLARLDAAPLLMR